MIGRSLLAAALWAVGAVAAQACDYSVPPPTELVKNAAMVFVGRVLSTGESTPRRIGEPVRFSVVEAFQGVTKGATVLASAGGGGCAGSFRVAESYLVFLQRTRAGELPSASLPSGTVTIREAPAVLRWLRNRTRPAWNIQLLGVVWDIDSAASGYRRNPLPGVEMIVSGNGRTASATTDRDGIYQMGGLLPGEYEISASSPGRDIRPNRMKVDRCCVFADIGAFVDGHVGGAVRDAAGGSLDGIRVEIAAVWPQGEVLPFRDAITTGGGCFLFHGIPPGQYRVGVNVLTSPTVRQPYTTTFRPISIAARQEMKGIDLTLPASLGGRSVSVRVVTPNGQGAAGARVSVGDEPGYTTPVEFRANEDGEAHLVWVEGAKFRVMAAAQDTAGRGLYSDWQRINSGNEPVQMIIHLHYYPRVN